MNNTFTLERTVAGLLLKNKIGLLKDGNIVNLIKQSVLGCVVDPIRSIRRTSATLISSILRIQGFESWQGIITFVDQQIKSNLLNKNNIGVDGFLCTLELICEDCNREIQISPQKPLNLIMPTLIELLKMSEKNILKSCLTSINSFIIDMPQAFVVLSEKFLQNIFALAVKQEMDSEVVIELCKSFNLICDNKISLVEPFLSQIIKWMMLKTKSDDEDIAMEASNFWQIITDTEYIEYRHILAPNVESYSFFLFFFFFFFFFCFCFFLVLFYFYLVLFY